ncbi:MAG: AraC family transcriptional regulator [Cyanobacteria bacterium P01_F01_bin.150]
MRINFSYGQYSMLLDEFRQNRWITSCQEGNVLQTDWHSPFVNGHNRFVNLRSDLQIQTWSQIFLDTLEIVDCGSAPVPATFIFLLEGFLQANYRDSTYCRDIQVKSGHNLLIVNGLGKRVVWRSPYDLKSQTVEVFLSIQQLIALLTNTASPALEVLQHYLNHCPEQPYFHPGPITPEMQMVLHQYLHCPYKGTTQQLYLESKATELIALKLAQISQMAEDADVGRASGCLSSSLNTKDTERVHRAREILLDNMAHPPSLQQLAQRVGIGDYKLKQDFRSVYGTTVFGYLRSHRMEQARQLLAAQRMSVSEVARFVGYSSLSKFTAAFKRQFGVLPSTCLGKRINRN